MIDFNEIRKKHYSYEYHNSLLDKKMEKCLMCQAHWPCEVITILEEFELFIKKIKFNAEIVDSWIKDYTVVDISYLTGGAYACIHCNETLNVCSLRENGNCCNHCKHTIDKER